VGLTQIGRMQREWTVVDWITEYKILLPSHSTKSWILRNKRLYTVEAAEASLEK